MTDKPDNFDLPRSWMLPYAAPSRKGVKTFAGHEDISASEVVRLIEDGGTGGPTRPGYQQAGGSDGNQDSNSPRPFKSRFSQWIRTVALILLLVFLPEQVSWAFNYNPLILWGQQDRAAVSVSPDASADEIVSARIAASVNHLLNQVAYKDKTRVQLRLTNAAISNPDLNQTSLLIDSDSVFTKNRIRRITEWLREPGIHPLNCGVHALKDILASYDVDTSLEELAISSLMVDLMNDIVLPGEPKLKTSLFAINEIVEAYGLGFKVAKVAPEDVLKLQMPFIANFQSEHFVTVNSVDATQVYYSDIGRALVASIPEFTAQLTGFVLAPELEKQRGVAFEYVPDSLTPFIWGNKWVDRSDQLPGLISDGELIVGAVIAAVAAYFGANVGALEGVAGGFQFAMGVGAFAGTMGQICQMKWGCSESGAMILTVAISVGATMGMGGWANAATEAAKQTATRTALEAGKQAALNAGNAASAAAYQLALAGLADTAKYTLLNLATDVAKGMAIGAALGYVKYEIAQELEESLGECDKDDGGCKIIRNSIISIVSSLGANVGVGVVTGGLASAFGEGGGIRRRLL